MKLFGVILTLLLLTGCFQTEEKELRNKVERDQVESYIDTERKDDNITSKFMCIVTSDKDGSKQNAEFIMSFRLSEDVECPTDLAPFNSEWAEIMGIVGSTISAAFFFIGVVIIKRLGFFKLLLASSEGKLSRIVKGVGYLIGLGALTPIPTLGYVSSAYIFLWFLIFSSMHEANINANYIERPAAQAQNIKIHKPNSLYAAPQFENLIRFYESAIAVNEDRNTDINFSVEGDELSAETFYKNNILAFNIKLNTTAYTLCDKYSLGCGKDYQVQQLSKIIKAAFNNAEFHARKIVNFKASLYSLGYEDFRKMSCENLQNYSLSNVNASVAVAYRYRAAECVSDEFNEMLNSVGSSYGNDKAQVVDLCPMAVKTAEEAASCVSHAYQTSLYAGSVATELYHKIYQTEKANALNMFTMVLLKFSGNNSTLTESGKIFYKSLDIKFFNDLKNPAFENTFKPSAFSINFTNTFNPNLPDARWLKKLDTEFDYKDSSTNDSSISYENIVSDLLTGPDGVCGLARKQFCASNPLLITDKYACRDELAESVQFGINVAQCGLTLSALNGLAKRFDSKNRSRETQGSVSNSLMSMPNVLTGLKIAAPIAAITSLNDMLDDPWSNSEFQFQQHEALYILFWTIMSNNEVRDINDSIANKLTAYGTVSAVGRPVLIAMFLIFIPISIIAYLLSKLISSLFELIKNEKEQDETLDLDPFLINLFKIFIRAFCYLVGFFIADHCYNEVVRALNDFNLSGNLIQTDSILATLFHSLSNEVIKLGIELLFITLYYGGIEGIVVYIYKIAFNEEIAETIEIEEAKQTLDNSKQAIKK